MQSEVALHKLEQIPDPAATELLSPGAIAAVVEPDRTLATQGTARREGLVVRMADASDRETIYRLRHDVYAREIGQHPVNAARRLTDPLDSFNAYIVICRGDRIVGFVSVTPPGGSAYAIDKYLRRDELPFRVDERLYEIRLLTVLPPSRRTLLALALMWAAFRWAETRGGTHIAAVGRIDLLGMYDKVGMRPTGQRMRAGAVTFELMHGTSESIRAASRPIWHLFERIAAGMDWRVGVAFETPASCDPGGDFSAAARKSVFRNAVAEPGPDGARGL